MKTTYSAAQANAMAADCSITNNPVFSHGGTPLNSRNASQDDVWLSLAKYVPAVSSPVGELILDQHLCQAITLMIHRIVMVGAAMTMSILINGLRTSFLLKTRCSENAVAKNLHRLKIAKDNASEERT